MRLKFCGPMGYGGIVLDDDATDEEIARVLMIAATTEPGNGSGRVFNRTKNEEEENA